MSAVQETARALAAQVAYPSDGNRASKWMPPVHAPSIPAPEAAPLWNLTNTARAIGVEPDEYDGDDWRGRAACYGMSPATFYPDKGDTLTFGRAVATCTDCPVRVHCLCEALNVEERFGVFGGLSEHRRRTLRVGQRAAAGVAGQQIRLRPIVHGGEGGYSTHLRRGEAPCDACIRGRNDAQSRRQRERRRTGKATP